LMILTDSTSRRFRRCFRLIKLSANFPNVSYVVSFDEMRVADALGRKYGPKCRGGRKFLEKILQSLCRFAQLILKYFFR
jgi:hypothetical protein